MNDVRVEIGWIEGEDKLCQLHKGGDLKQEMKQEY